MIRKFIFIIAVLIPAIAHPQSVKNNNVIIGQADSVHSDILGEKRKVWVYVPASAKSPDYTPQRYPVLYVLDGADHFFSLAGIVQQMSEKDNNTVYPPMIIVAILNTNRTRDLTPSNSTDNLDGSKMPGFRSSGGAEKFTSFIEKELMPYIEGKYPTAPYKVLVGHSFGGLTVMNTLLNHPDLFNAYLAIDPSMWWDHRKLLDQAKTMLADHHFEGKKLYLGIANTMTGVSDTAQVRKDTLAGNGHIRAILDLKDVLQSHPANGLKFTYKYYPDDNHTEVPLIAEYDGLRYLFNFFRPDNQQVKDLFNPTSTANPAAILSAHYQDISKVVGFQWLPAEQMIDELGGYFLSSGRPDRAFQCFALNLRNYPKSFNAYSSMGDYYAAMKDKQKAIEYYQKSLAVKDIPETRQKLRQLAQATKM